MVASAPRDLALGKQVLHRRLEELASSSPLVLIPALASIAVFVTACGGLSAPDAVLAWAGIACLFVCGRLIGARRILPLGEDVGEMRRKWRAANVWHALGSLTWGAGLPLVMWFCRGSEAGIQTISLAGAALMCGASLTFRWTPAAGLFHVLAIGCGLALALWIESGWQAAPALALIAIYAATLGGVILERERAFRASCRSALELRESEQAVGRLLTEHESQVADWLWSIDSVGNLRNVPHELAEALRAPAEMLEGKNFLSLIEPGRDRDRIAHLIGERRSFRDESVPLAIDGERRRWRLSGHPRPDGGMAGSGRDVSCEQGFAQRIRAMARIDPLTGLANRHSFNQRLLQLLGPKGADAKPVALLLLDLDDFRAINDVQGHIFGDGLLREMGARLLRESRENDLIARLSGDEFAILMEAPAGDGMLIERAHRLLAAARTPFQLDGQSARISTSIGIARSGEIRDAAELLRRADLALYAAKAKGRDQMALFDEKLDRRARERRALELELREAVGRDEMVIHYQPIISLQSGATVGYEALLRWRHPERGLLLPEQFLAIAEESGLIVGLGDWAIRKALSEVAEWRGDFRIAINLSPSQMRNPHLIGTVDRALAASGIAPNRMELEITENVLLGDANAGAATIKRLRALGLEIALDDFGTGFSSLSYLRRFRFDRVKIDQVFVRDIETSDESQAIVSTITRLAEALGMRTTAEGVERPEQLDLLRKLGCDEAQGFVILEPVEAKRIEESRTRGDDLPAVTEELEGYREARRAASMRSGTLRA